MRRATRPAGRAGFTLVELLIVIAILALLAALVAAGIGRIREGQQARVTDQTLTKLQLALDKQWKAICDQCRDDRRDYQKKQTAGDFKNLVGFCDGDVERAEALWMFLNLKRGLPETFQEARNPVELKLGATTVVSLPPSATFRQVPNNAPVDRNAEAAVLLYLVLGQGGRGSSFALDDATQGAQMTLQIPNAGQYPAFKDSYGTFITYRRFHQNTEIANQPLVRSKLTFTDPLDPVGRLHLWGNVTNRTAARAALGFVAGNVPNDFDGKNKLVTVIAAGADARDLPDNQKTTAFDLSGAGDDAFGYRLLRQGSKGD